jgi:uncharacterized protein (DUF736 family)
MTEYDNTNRGALFANSKRESDNHPTHTGSINVNGVDHWLSAWVKESKSGQKFFSLSIKPKDQHQPAQQPQQSQPAPAADDFDDSIPF